MTSPAYFSFGIRNLGGLLAGSQRLTNMLP